MAYKNKKAAGTNHFALLETDDPGDMLLEQPQAAAPASLTEQLFGKAYPSAWEEVMRNRQNQQYNSAPPASAKAKARADSKKKGAQGQGSGARKQQQGGRRANGAAGNNDDEAPAPRLYDLAEFPSLK